MFKPIVRKFANTLSAAADLAHRDRHHDGLPAHQTQLHKERYSVAEAGRMSNVLYPSVDLRCQMRCGTCGRLGRPLLRRYGMPEPDVDWERHEQDGRYTLMGCCVSADDAPYECRHCGEPTFLASKPPSPVGVPAANQQH